MSTSSVFWTLVHNDSRLGSTFRLENHSKGKFSDIAASFLAFGLFFALAALLLGFGLHSSDLFSERFVVILNLISSNGVALFFLAFIPFSFTLEMLQREWKNGTVGWWLSLPYSRKLLLAAKSMAGFLRFIKILLIFVIITAFLTTLTIYLKPDVGNIALLHDIPQRLLYSSVIAILVSPLFLILGTLAVLEKSKIRLLPIFLPAFALGIIGVILLSSRLRAVFSSDAYLFPPWLSILLIFAISTGLSTLIFFFATNVLEHKVEL